MAEDYRHGGTLESLVARLLAYANYWIPAETEDRIGLAQQYVFDAFEELIESDALDLHDEKELFRHLAGMVRRRIGTAVRVTAS